MTHAYDESALSNAMRVMATAFDYVANTLHFDLTEFMNEFIAKGFAEEWEKGNPTVISGISGYELAQVVLSTDKVYAEPVVFAEKSPEYWCGYVLAYYQWYSDKSFKRIIEKLSIRCIIDMYPTMHEADITRFVALADEMTYEQQTRLQRVRKIAGLSQKELSVKSGVSVATIRAYEQRKKDIRKAQVDSLIRIGKALHCRIDDLID